ncbi:monocarboxylate transporter 13-like isoform X1 [Patiria miniata]|uniref:Major facilitator superfamily (MFS) profile domain-containing protein n=1 Tax=Patiria miniata TaxID=46514 RepID=A0A914A2G2_PATMI|nr:monocarboxylate transporter 13-like isoform X1 [Patiria miniata]
MTEKFYNRLPVVEDRGANNNTADGGQTIATNAEQRKRWREVCSKIRRPGWKWVVLLGAFLLRAVFSGFIANYTTLSVKLREFYGTNEEILGWIGSLIFCSRSMCSPLTAAFAVKIGYRSAIFLGVLCSATSLMVSSFVPGIHWYFLTLSVLLGAGISLACFSSYDYLMSYFHKTFVRAAGFMAIASSAGLMICAPAMEALLESIGLHNTLRVFAGIFLLSALSAFTIRPSPAEKRRMSVIQVPLATRNPDSPTPAEPIVPIKPPVHAKKTFRESMAVFSSLLRSADMWILGVMGLTLCLASSFTYLYMVSFLNTLGLSVKTSAFTLSMMGVGEFVGTTLCVLLGDRVPLLKMEVLAIATLGAALATAALTVITVYPGVLTLVIVLGLCRAIYNLMVFPSVIECMGKQRKLECCSISSMMCGIGYLPGGVIGGALFDATGSYLYSLLVCVALYLTSSLLLVWCAYRFRRARRTQGEMIDQSAESKGKGDKGSEVEQNQEVYVVETIMTTV